MTNWHGEGSRWGYDFGKRGAGTYLLNDDGEPISDGYHSWTYAGKSRTGKDTFHAKIGSAKYLITVEETNRDGLAVLCEPANGSAEHREERLAREDEYGLDSLVDSL